MVTQNPKIVVSAADIKRVLAEVQPARMTGIEEGDFCNNYNKYRPIALTAITILQWAFPPAASVIAALIAVADKLCKGS